MRFAAGVGQDIEQLLHHHGISSVGPYQVSRHTCLGPTILVATQNGNSRYIPSYHQCFRPHPASEHRQSQGL